MKKWCVGWGVTSACNMKCAFCYSKTVRYEPNEQLSLDDWKKFVTQNHKHISSINYGTGENSLEPDWYKLVAHVKNTDASIIQSVTTNGHLSHAAMNDARVRNIVDTCISEIDVSLDYAAREQHNVFRGQAAAYDWAINTLEMFASTHIRTSIVMIGTNDTLQLDNIDGIMSIAKRYNVNVRVNLYRPTDGIDQKSKTFIADYSVIMKALEHIASKYKVLAISDPLFSAILLDDTSDCEKDPSGVNSIRVLPDGSITPSTYLISKYFRMHNIRTDNALEHVDYPNEWENIKIPQECKNCKYLSTCGGGVYDRRYLWYGNFEERDPYCPYRSKNYLPKFKIKLDKNQQLESVHHGYLPTMFFAPK